MTPLQQAAQAVINKFEHSHPLTGVAVLELLKALEAEQAQAVEPVQRHLPENVARLLIEHYLKDDHGYDEGGYTIEKQGDSAHESHIWAFWIFESDSTSYLHDDGKIEWCGTSWEPIEQAQAVEPATGERAELVAKLRGSADLLQIGKVEDWDGLAAEISQAADMLEADVSLINEGNKAQQVATSYDQQALELCDACGWKAIMPGEPCFVCNMKTEAQQVAVPPGYALVPTESLLNIKNRVNTLATLSLKAERYSVGRVIKQDIADMLAAAQGAKP